VSGAPPTVRLPMAVKLAIVADALQDKQTHASDDLRKLLGFDDRLEDVIYQLRKHGQNGDPSAAMEIEWSHGTYRWTGVLGAPEERLSTIPQKRTKKVDDRLDRIIEYLQGLPRDATLDVSSMRLYVEKVRGT
jgi:hypothetical protein